MASETCLRRNSWRRIANDQYDGEFPYSNSWTFDGLLSCCFVLVVSCKSQITLLLSRPQLQFSPVDVFLLRGDRDWAAETQKMGRSAAVSTGHSLRRDLCLQLDKGRVGSNAMVFAQLRLCGSFVRNSCSNGSEMA
jgi:hypothetical protein